MRTWRKILIVSIKIVVAVVGISVGMHWPFIGIALLVAFILYIGLKYRVGEHKNHEP